MNIKVDVGCGNKKKEGSIGIDLKDTNADVYADLKENLPFKDSTVDEVYSNGVLEYIPYIQDDDIRCSSTFPVEILANLLLIGGGGKTDI